MRTKCFLLGLLFLLLPNPQAQATTYTVMASGGGNFSTIGACAAQAKAGDTCVIFAGTYNETVTPANSGSAGSPITFSTNPGDSVTVTGFNLGTLSYITIQGSSSAPMIITQTISWLAITNSIFQYISNTGGAGGNSCFGGKGWYQTNTPSSNNQFLNLTLAYCGGKTANDSGAIELEGHYNLFDTINCSYSQACITTSGQFNVVRNSDFGPTSTTVIGSNHSQPIENSVACGGSSGDIPGGMQHLLYENNNSTQWRGGDSHGTALITDTGSTVCGTTTNVFRFSQTMDSGSYSTEIYSSLNSYFYNNSFSDTQLDAGTKDKEDYQFDPNAPNSRTINNIFANMTQVGSEDWCIYAETPLVENHNLCYNTNWTGSWYGPSTSDSNSYDSTDIFNHNPLFNAPDTDLHVQSSSPAIGAGGPLTTATNSGSVSTSLTVADAGFFSWGYGIANVQPDWIRIGPSVTAQISNINYSTNTITLASPVSWSSGTSIYLYKNSNGTIVLNGANPNIGFDPNVTSPENTVQLTVDTSPQGLSYSVDGAPYTGTQTVTWTIGSTHTLSTTAAQTPSSGTQDTFSNWSDGTNSLSDTVTATASTANYTAFFDTSYQLTLSASPAAGGTVSPTTGGYYAQGSAVPLVATPNATYTFADWTGNVASSGSASTTITMNAPQSVMANFKAAGQPPAVTSVNSAIFTVGLAGSFTVTATGTPTPSITEAGKLPKGVTFSNSTNILSGTPGAGTAGAYSITFTASNGAGTNAVQSFTLTVVNPSAPTLTSVAPLSDVRGTVISVMLTGANFTTTGTTVAVSGSGVTVSATRVVNSTTITATFTISSTAAAGARNVTVKNPGGTSAAETFTVLGPTLTAISPASGGRGTSVPVTLTGSGLTGATAITISGSGVTCTNLSVVNDTTVTATFTIASSATLSTRNVGVTTATEGTTNTATFTVVR